MSISIIQLKYAVAVYNFRNFSTAAERCFVTQPTLSMQINRLEKDLGCKLFNRKKHPVGITKAGEKFITQAKIVITEFSRLEEIMSYGKDDYSGTFRLGIIPTIAPYLLPLFLNAFSAKLPEVDLVINELTTAEIITGLRKDIIDAGILALPIKQSDIAEMTLYYEPFMAFVPEHHSLYKKKYLSQGELPYEDIILLKEGHCFRNQVLSLCGGQAAHKSNTGFKFESGSLETLIKLVKKEYGYTLLPKLAVKEMSDPEDLKLLRQFTKPVPSREIGIIYPASGIRKRLIKKVADIIKQSVPKDMLNSKNETVVPIFEKQLNVR